MQHTIRTTHIQRLIQNALNLAERVDDQKASHIYGKDGSIREAPFDEVAIYLPLSPPTNVRTRVLPEHVLCKAISDLRHAAAELDAERLSCFGWAQV